MKTNYLIYSKWGFGHAVRMIAVIREVFSLLPAYPQIGVFSHPNLQGFIRDSLPDKWMKIHDLYYEFLFDKRSERDMFLNKNKKNLSNWENSLIITDFLMQTKYLDFLHTFLIGIVDSDVTLHEIDSPDVCRWKNLSAELINNLDLVFNVNIFSEEIVPQNVIKIPPIVRKITRNSHQVKNLHGLKAHERFALYYTGVKGVKWEYQYLRDLEKALCNWDLSLPLIIVHGLGTNINESVFKGDNFINIHYDPEVQDYVNAAEFVIAKPGMSLFSECTAYCTPLLMCKPDSAETELKYRIYKRMLDIDPPLIESFTTNGVFSKVDYLLTNMERIQSSFEKIKCNGAEIVAKGVLDITQGLMNGYPKNKILDEFNELGG